MPRQEAFLPRIVYRTAFFNSLPGTNLGMLCAGIFIGMPVLGFLPTRAFLLATKNVPNPTRVTFCFFFKEAVIPPIRELKAASALDFVRPVSFAIFATRSPLFKESPFLRQSSRIYDKQPSNSTGPSCQSSKILDSQLDGNSSIQPVVEIA